MLFGEKSVLVELEQSAAASIEEIKKTFPEAEVRLGLKSVLITFKEIGDYTKTVKENFPELSSESFDGFEPKPVPIRYDGEDLSSLSGFLHLSDAELIYLHQGTIWQVALIGFAPGFPYLIPETNIELFSKIPRLDSPRSKVPAKSVALAAGMCCIYPNASPGGWQLIGTTDVELFDPEATSPSLLKAGDRIRFEVIT